MELSVERKEGIGIGRPGGRPGSSGEVRGADPDRPADRPTGHWGSRTVPRLVMPKAMRGPVLRTREIREAANAIIPPLQLLFHTHTCIKRRIGACLLSSKLAAWLETKGTLHAAIQDQTGLLCC
jgi:hypothetical protein